MSTFPSIRQNLRLIEGGLWHTPSDSRPTVVKSGLKRPTLQGFSRSSYSTRFVRQTLFWAQFWAQKRISVVFSA
jgi:hypothetical protein